jgi:hypothetical protein
MWSSALCVYAQWHPASARPVVLENVPQLFQDTAARFSDPPDLTRIELLAPRPDTPLFTNRNPGLTSGCAWGAVLLFLPSSVGTALLGQTWQGARQVILPLAITTAGLAVTLGASAAVRSLAAVRRSLHTRIIVAVFKVVAAVTGAIIAGTPDAAWGLAVSSIGGAALWWWQLNVALAGHQLRIGHTSAAVQTVAVAAPSQE